MFCARQTKGKRFSREYEQIKHTDRILNRNSKKESSFQSFTAV